MEDSAQSPAMGSSSVSLSGSQGCYLIAGPHEFPRTLEKLGAQILHGVGRQGSLLRKDAELSVEESGEVVSAFHPVITVLTAEIDFAFVAVDLRAEGNLEDNDGFALALLVLGK